LQRTTVFHEDVYDAYFQPFRHPAAHFNIWGGHGLETFGDDFQAAKKYAPNFVWTVVDGCESPNQWITPGLHYVNRVSYLLTHEPHDWAPIEFRVERSFRAITPRGLACRMTTLRRVIRLNQIARQDKA